MCLRRAPKKYIAGAALDRAALLLRKSGSAGNLTRTSGSAARNSDHRGGLSVERTIAK
jgi:hypothetical protein